MKLRDEVNQVETQKIYKESTKPGAGSSRKIENMDKPSASLTKGQRDSF